VHADADPGLLGHRHHGAQEVLLPGCLRAKSVDLRSFRSARRRNFGDLTTIPSDSTANDVRPRSTPTSVAETGNRWASTAGSVSTTKLAKYWPAASLITVTLAGTEGSPRDQRTSTSPIFGRRRRPLAKILNFAFAVNRTACLWSFRDLGRGGPTFGPLRLPAADAKKFRYAAFRSARACWRTTADTSMSQACSGVAFILVSRADNSESVMNGSPAACASSRSRSASLNTTRAHPNAFASAVRWPGAG
jgi:hypothetical protein